MEIPGVAATLWDRLVDVPAFVPDDDAEPPHSVSTLRFLLTSADASRVDINWERYVKILDIEASCAIDIASTMILPADRALPRRAHEAPSSRGINAICEQVSGLADSLVDAIEALEHAQHKAHEAGSVQAEAKAFATEVIPAQGPPDGGRRARDARRRRPLAAAEVPRAPLPVLRAPARLATTGSVIMAGHTR